MPSDEQTELPDSDAKNVTIEVSFGKSSSINYNIALALAHELPYSETGKGQDIRHRVKVEFPLDNTAVLGKIRNLVNLIASWRSARFLLNGKPYQYNWELDREIGAIRDCYDQRQKSLLADHYCDGKSAPDQEVGYFGCRFVTAVTHVGAPRDYHTRESRRWYQFGTLADDHKSFRVDKPQILGVVKASTEAHLCTKCPVFDWSRVARRIAELPEVIDLGPESYFEVKFSEANTSKALGIQPKHKSGDIRISVKALLGDEDESDECPVERCIPNVRYSDVAGQQPALEEIRNVVELPLTHPEYFLQMGIEPQRGIILYGPPGNGKTLIAKAVATEAKAHLEIISGPEIKSKWVGQSEQNLRKAFVRARKLQPSIILIDELDSIAPRRDLMTQQHDVSLISQLLVLLDGMETRGQVAVIGTTNRIDAIDPAFLRPGRFDYHICVPAPDRAGRLAVLTVHLSKMKAADDTKGVASQIDLDGLADRMDGFSAAEIAAVCREAGLVAIKQAIQRGMPAGQVSVTKDDIAVATVRIRSKRVNTENGPEQ
jgi:ATP-dependent 26S proteasome regulatory subunit